MDKLIILNMLSVPDDKSELIPAFIELLLIIALCGVALMVFKRISKKQELKTKDLEERILRERQQQNAQNNTNQ